MPTNDLPEDIQPGDPEHIEHHDLLHRKLNPLFGDWLATGSAQGLLSTRPTDLDTDNVGFFWWNEDLKRLDRWDGTAWDTVIAAPVGFNAIASGQGVYADMPSAASMIAAGGREGWAYWATDRAARFMFDGSDWVMVGFESFYAEVKRTTAQTVPNDFANAVLVSFSEVVEQHGDVWSLSDPTRLYAPVDGFYTFGGYMRYDANAVGVRELDILWNGTEIYGSDIKPTAGAGRGTVVSATGGRWMDAGHWVEYRTSQNSGGPLNIDDAGFNDYIRAWLTRTG